MRTLPMGGGLWGSFRGFRAGFLVGLSVSGWISRRAVGFGLDFSSGCRFRAALPTLSVGFADDFGYIMAGIILTFCPHPSPPLHPENYLTKHTLRQIRGRNQVRSGSGSMSKSCLSSTDSTKVARVAGTRQICSFRAKSCGEEPEDPKPGSKHTSSTSRIVRDFAKGSGRIIITDSVRLLALTQQAV
jgi:hypothetical protein